MKPGPLSRLGVGLAHHRRAALLALILVGLVGATALIAVQGFTGTVRAIAAVGWRGLAAVCAIRIVSFLLRAVAWRLVVPGPPPSLGACLWARALREGFGNLFVIGPISGELAGGRWLILAGIEMRAAAASVIVDLVLEAVSQILFIVAGVILVVVSLSATALTPWLIIVAAALVAIGLVPFAARSPFALHLFETALSKLARRSAVPLAGGEVLSLIVGRMLKQRWVLLAAGLLHLAAWPLIAAETWTLCALTGWPLTIVGALALEALVLAARTAFFFMPGSLGVQEGGYVLVGALVGLASGPALAISLLKRARDFVLGLPAVVVWQAQEWTQLHRRRKKRLEVPAPRR